MREHGLLPGWARPATLDTEECKEAEHAASLAPYWKLNRDLFGDGTSEAFANLRRYEFCRMGDPEAKAGEVMLRCLPWVECTMPRHLHPAGFCELNKPEFRAVWDTLDGGRPGALRHAAHGPRRSAGGAARHASAGRLGPR